MVSLFEQYETETQKTNEFTDDVNTYRSGYLSASLNTNDNEEIFKTQKIQINTQDKTIDQFEKCGGQIAILFKPNTIRLLHPENKTDETIEYPEAINRFFLDKTGKHLLVSTEKNEFYYYSKFTKKIKSISKLKGNLVTSIGWNKNSTDKTTDSILVGTNKGVLYEVIINSTNEGLLSTFGESYCKQVYSFGYDQAINSIEIIHLRKENNYSGPSVENIYDVFVATSTRLHEFIGSDAKNMSSSSASSAANIVSNLTTTPIFTSIFSYYESKTPNELANFHEMPGDLGYSQLHIRNNTKTRKKTLAWMAGAGVLLYELDPYSLAKFSAANFHNESIKRLIGESNHEIIRYPNVREDHYVDLGDNDPIGISLTEFHLAIFYKSQVKILCLLNKEIVLNQKLDAKSIGGKVKGVWNDSVTGDFGSYTARSIIKYVPNKESRKIWKIYLNKNEFELAKQYCRDNPGNMNIVLTKQAESLFNSKKYIESAIFYAQTQNSFEEICLKYLELGNFTALRTFLTHKLSTLDVEREITQTTVVIAYIIEIFLNQLSDLIQEKLYDDYDSLHKDFQKFLDNQKVKTCLKESKEAIYKIFASHGNTGDMVYFAEAMKDYPQIIMHYIQEENYRKSLEALAKQNNKEIFYKYSPIFFELLPKEIVDLWIKNSDYLKPVKLLPSLASCSLHEDQINEAIRYLEFCVNKLKSTDQAIHNNLLILFLKYRPEELLTYVRFRKDDKEIYFDELMIARLCTERSNQFTHEACVYLYTRMGWYEEAVELALNVNVELAREVASSFQSDLSSIYSDELKKVLWLRIARHVIEKENDVNKAMNFLQDLTESIAIEDILPYFPDFVTIDQFKDAIRTSLAAYTDKINSLKENIDQAAKSAQLIRKDIQGIRQKSCSVNTNDCCAKCKFRLMTRRFYVFPCNHKFHADCLYKTSLPYLMPSKQKRIDELQKLLQDIQTIPVNNVTGGLAHFAKTKSNQQQVYSNEEILTLKSELDELLANECPWCGEKILRSIDEPFIDPLDYESVYRSWL